MFDLFQLITSMHSSKMRTISLLTIYRVCLQIRGSAYGVGGLPIEAGLPIKGTGRGLYLPHGIVGRKTPQWT